MIDNVCLDPMHDVLEGVCRYNMANILNVLINQDKLFTLETLNDRIRFFDYGTNTGKNIPVSITCNIFKTDVLMLSASEMSFLCETSA